ncbi:uncharacterized protein LOC143376467 [Andrena cerasifolii]|uniref:uncharacterized protein LOC143376467 n=1 Tax=Andrena cerasifolii TaxID=2819439 RepID=UPI0040383A3A
MPPTCPLFLVRLVKFLCLLDIVASTKPTSDTIQRSRRAFDAKYLVFPQGSNVQLVYCLTVSTYSKPAGFFTMGVTAGQAWELPSDSMDFRKYPPAAYHRRSRRQLYRKLESLLGTQGKDGRACVLKAICQAAARNRTNAARASFLQEILHAVFTLSESFDDSDSVTEYERAYFWGESCAEMEDRCPSVF